MAMDPVWKRVVGGLCGIGITVAVLLLLRQRGVSGAQMAQGQEVIVFGAAAAGVALWILNRNKRRQP